MGCPTLISSENDDKNEVKTVKKKQKQKKNSKGPRKDT